MGTGTTSDVVISAQRLGKSFLIGHQAERERYTALRDVVMRSLRGMARSASDLVRGRPLVAGDEVEEFWALDDVSFEIRRGDVVGIIGRNGAGKSTLLKVLSRITEPSRGRVCIKGRVASLLEVGTGFHPELSGRENIYLNGAILGMTRAEIRARFDAIVAFAEVERFLDTPVKRYSSGMYVRLAFAVAAHLEPEILVVDEVLAVGDAEFQKKCLGKMQDVAGHGRTVLFVSHNMAAIRKLCTRAILLAGGRVAAAGTVESAVSRYTSALGAPTTSADLSRAPRRGTGEVRVACVGLASGDGVLRPVPVFGALEAALTLSVPQAPAPSACIWILIRNAAGDDVAMIMQKDTDRFRQYTDGETVRCTIDIALAPGPHTLTVGLLDQRGGIVDWVDDAIAFAVDERFSDGAPFDHRLGMTSLRARWTSGQSHA